jgi:inositol-hexakisphosphate kinase
VDISEDPDGYITLRGSPPAHYSRTGRAALPKMRLRRCGSIEIERNVGEEDRLFQDERGKEEVNPWALKCHRDNLKKVGIQLTGRRYILLENLTLGRARPCVLDLKLGTQQHGDHASASKRLSKNAKVASSTSGSLGLRLGGMQVYQANLGRYICRSKNYGRGLSPSGLRAAIRQFLTDGLTVRTDVVRALLRRLGQLRELLAGLDSFRFYTSSLLITYDGEGEEQAELVGRNNLSTGSLPLLGGPGPLLPLQQRSMSCHLRPADRQCVDVRLIDFAHSTHRGMPGSSVEHEGPDSGLLFGIGSLVGILTEVLQPEGQEALGL